MHHLRIRESTASDIAKLVRWFHDESSAIQWAGGLFSWPIVVEEVVKLFEAPNTHSYVIFEDEGEPDSIIGHIGLRMLSNAASNTACLGPLSIDPQERGRGLCYPFVTTALRTCFERHRLNRVELNVFDFNKSAIRCYERAGFKTEGLRQEVCNVDGRYVNLIHMAILAADWHSTDR